MLEIHYINAKNLKSTFDMRWALVLSLHGSPFTWSLEMVKILAYIVFFAYLGQNHSTFALYIVFALCINRELSVFTYQFI